MGAAVEFRTLGPLEVVRAGTPLELGGRRQRAVVAYLLVKPNQPVSVDRMIDELWGDDAPPRATASLQAYVSNLRRILEPDRPLRAPARLLVSRPPGYALQVDPEAVDALVFERMASEAAARLAAGDPLGALEAAGAALQRWRGEYLADFAYDGFAQAERARLDDLRLALSEQRLEARLALGEHTAAVTESESLVAAHPLRERLWELRMLALYRSGRQADALRAFQEARTVLDEELGLEPGPDLRRLERAVLDQDPELAAPTRRASSGVRPVVQPPSRTPPAAGPEPGTMTTTAAAVGRAPLFGREGQQRVLADALAAAEAGRVTFAVVTGEAGIGKTALVTDLAARAAERGASVAWGRSQEQAGQAALWPWSQIMTEVLGSDTERPPELRLLLPAESPAVDQPDVSRLRLYDVVARELARVAAERTLVVVLDDLHWADHDSLRLIEFLATELSRGRLLLVATIRSDEAGPDSGIGRTMATLARRGDLVRVDLAGLDERAVVEFAEAVSGGPIDRGAASALGERTGGNPFFLTEVVRLLVAERRLSEVAAGQVPAGVRDVVRRRTERLPEDSRTVLRVAALIGRDFPLELLATACGLVVDDTLDALEPPLMTGLVVESGTAGERFRFSHALVAETLVDDLPTTRRRRLHARIAAAVEDLHGAHLEPHLSQLAHHYGEAASVGHAAAAARYAIRAAGQAEALGAVTEAARLWTTAAVAADLDAGRDPAERVDLRIRVARAEVRAGHLDTGRDAVVDAVDRAAAIDDPERMLQACLALLEHGAAWHWADFRIVHDDVLGRIERTLAMLDPQHPSRAILLGVFALGVYQGDVERAEVLSQQSVAMARSVGDERLIARCLLAQLTVLNAPDRVVESEAVATEVIELGRRVGAPELEAGGHAARIDARVALADLDGAAADHRRGWELLAQVPLLTLRSQLAFFPVKQRLVEGRFRDAEAAAQEAREMTRIAGVGTDGTLAMQLLDIMREEGRLDELLPVLELMTTPQIQAGNLRAQLLVESGRVDAARKVIAAQGGIELPGRDWFWSVEVATAAEIACGLGDRVTGAALYQDLLPHAGRLVSASSVGLAGPVDLYLGRLAVLLDEVDAADAHLDAARALALRLRSPTWEAQANLRLGLFRVEHGRSEEGLDHLRSAIDIGRRLGMARVVREASAVLEA